MYQEGLSSIHGKINVSCDYVNKQPEILYELQYRIISIDLDMIMLILGRNLCVNVGESMNKATWIRRRNASPRFWLGFKSDVTKNDS